MSVILGILRSLGAGESLIIAAVLGLTAWYMLKGVKIGKTIGGIFGSAVAYAVGALLVIAVAVGAGWLDPDPSAFISTVVGIVQALWQALSGPVLDLIEQVAP